MKSIYDEFEKEIKEIDAELDWRCGELPVMPHWLFVLMTRLDLMEDESNSNIVGSLAKAMRRTIEEEGTTEVLAVRDILGVGQ